MCSVTPAKNVIFVSSYSITFEALHSNCNYLQKKGKLNYPDKHAPHFDCF